MTSQKSNLNTFITPTSNEISPIPFESLKLEIINGVLLKEYVGQQNQSKECEIQITDPKIRAINRNSSNPQVQVFSTTLSIKKSTVVCMKKYVLTGHPIYQCSLKGSAADQCSAGQVVPCSMMVDVKEEKKTTSAFKTMFP